MHLPYLTGPYCTTKIFDRSIEHIVRTILHDIADQPCNIVHAISHVLVRLIRNTKKARAISWAQDIAGAISNEVDHDGDSNKYGSRRQQR